MSRLGVEHRHETCCARRRTIGPLFERRAQRIGGRSSRGTWSRRTIRPTRRFNPDDEVVRSEYSHERSLLSIVNSSLLSICGCSRIASLWRVG